MKIALVTDSHLSPRDALLAENWAAVDRWMGAVGVDLAIHLGDITADGAADAQELAHARRLIGASGRDVLFLPGNHDIGDGPAEVDPSHEPALGPERLAAYRQVFGPDWWSLGLEGWQIVGLNTQLLGAGGEEEARQWAWLEDTLASGEGPLGVMCHKPLRVFGLPLAATPGRYPPAAARRRLAALLARRDLRFVVSGHTHQALNFSEAGVEHVWAPSCAFVIPDAIQAVVGEKRVGAVLLDLHPGGHAFAVAEPADLIRHELFDLEHLYAQVRELRARHVTP
jgi:3',5'-cyclic AMP phosphodiesterase CpdA